VLGELSGEGKAHGSLDLARGECALLVVADELAGLVGDLVEDVRDERVHDGHALGRNACVGVHLLENLVDVDAVRFRAALLLLRALLASSLGLLLLLALLRRLRGHATQTHGDFVLCSPGEHLIIYSQTRKKERRNVPLISCKEFKSA
jgi:hypothetical protein